MSLDCSRPCIKVLGGREGRGEREGEREFQAEAKIKSLFCQNVKQCDLMERIHIHQQCLLICNCQVDGLAVTAVQWRKQNSPEVIFQGYKEAPSCLNDQKGALLTIP